MDLRRMLKTARKAGWDQRRTGSGHILLVAPTGQRVVLPSTPSDHRSLLNSRAQLRRAGLAI